MRTLLVIEASPRGERSMSRGLTQRFVEAWIKKNPDGRVVERDLMKTDLPFVTNALVGGVLHAIQSTYARDEEPNSFV